MPPPRLLAASTAACSFPNVPVATVSLSADGTQMVCNTTAAFAASRMLSVTLNGQDYLRFGPQARLFTFFALDEPQYGLSVRRILNARCAMVFPSGSGFLAAVSL